jgi:adenosylhomocysteine nucleosidase
MPKVAIVAALEREVRCLTGNWRRVERERDGRPWVFLEQDEMVVVCGGIGVEAARRAAEAVIALYRPAQVQSVGFAGALDRSLRVGDIFLPSAVIDARDGSRVEIGGEGGDGTLLTFMTVADREQKVKLARAYGARAIDMEAAGVLAAAHRNGIAFGATKAISDELDFAMPAMEPFIDAQGQFRTAALAAFVAPRPWLWMGLATLERNSRKAARALASHLDRLRREQSHAVEANLV